VTVPVVVSEPVPPAAESLFELATLTDAPVAAAQVGVLVLVEVTAPLWAVHVMVAVPE
jgi:hypothetical protein